MHKSPLGAGFLETLGLEGPFHSVRRRHAPSAEK